MIGTTLSQFKITAKLGEGGMGEVYRAEDTKLGREVAIKVLPEAFVEDPERFARFEREAHVLASLNHPNIAAIYDLAEDQGTHFLVLELVEGEDLADRVSRGPVSVEEALALAIQIAEALEAAHDKGIVHRDLKPANVMVGRAGTVKILDFGLAKAWEPEAGAADLTQSPTLTAQMTQAGVILGTASYMSPEQARGQEVDKQTDIWAFGAVLYELLAGRRLFGGLTVTDTLAAILERKPDWEALPLETPTAIRRLLRRCLERDPRKRLHDIADARLEMDNGEDPTDTTQRSASQATPPWLMLILWLSVAAIVVAALIVFSGERLSGPEVTRFALSLSEGVSFVSGSGVTVSPDGGTVVYSASGGGQRLYRRDMDSLESVPIRGTEGGRRPFFSHDGLSVGFFTDSELRKVPLSGGISEPLADVIGASAGTWLEDDSIVFGSIPRELRDFQTRLNVDWQTGDDVTPTKQSLSRVSASGGELSPMPRFSENGGEESHAYPASIPGEQGFVSTGLSEGSSWIYLHRPGTGNPVRLVRGRRARVSSSGQLVFELDGTLWAVALDTAQATVAGEPVPVVGSFGSTSDDTPLFDLSAFGLSASGSLVYATAAAATWGNRTLFWVSRNGQEEPLRIDPKPYWFPQVSPGGVRIGLHIMDSENMDAYIHDLESGATSRLTFHPAYDGYPLWTPDGERVVFWSARDTGVMNLFVRPADGTGSVERLTDSPNRQVPYSWANDGALLVFEEYSPETSTDIWKISIDGDQIPETVLREPYSERRPAISPDGRWIAYQSNESGQWQIWVRPFPDVESGRWPVGAGGMSPKWSPDGRELYYRGDNAMMAARIDTTEGFSSEPPERLFEDRYVLGSAEVNPLAGAYAVAPDGRFLMMREMQQSQMAAELIVVRNWVQEFSEPANSP